MKKAVLITVLMTLFLAIEGNAQRYGSDEWRDRQADEVKG